MVTIVQLSDTHLSRRRAYTTGNFERVVELLAADPPDLIVHTGDIVLVDPDDDDDHQFAKELIDRLGVPVLALPGNHDVGEPHPAEPDPVTTERLDRFRRVWGSDRFTVDVEAWRLVGLDAMLLGSGLPDEDEQWAWLDDALGHDGPVAVFLHKPLLFPSDRADTTAGTLPSEPQQRLQRRLAASNVRLVASGHLHRHTSGLLPSGQAFVWAPTTAFLGHDRHDGARRTPGFVEYRFTDELVSWQFTEPPHLASVDYRDLLAGAADLASLPDHPYQGR